MKHLKIEADCRAALAAACKEDPGDGRLLAATLKDVARAQSVAWVSSEACVPQEKLCRLLSREDQPGPEAIRALIHALSCNAASRRNQNQQ